MSKYDKEIDSSSPEYDEAIEPLERETHKVRETHEVPGPRDGQGDERNGEDDRKV